MILSFLSGSVDKIKSYYGEIRFDIIDLIDNNINSLLDVGCGEGNTAFYLKEKYNIKIVDGIEILPKAGYLAQKKLDNVYLLNIEEIKNFSFSKNKLYDCILILDVLEHLHFPQKTLTKFHKVLSDNGTIIISLPNVRHYRVVFPLLFRNEWEYKDSGVLDRTHLKFFTYKSMVKLIESSGLEIKKVIKKKSYRRGFTIVNILSLGLLAPFSIFQYIFVCEKK